ncbi:MAG: hypothetical protein AAGG75_07335 [Bacteroidota bacterium]
MSNRHLSSSIVLFLLLLPSLLAASIFTVDRGNIGEKANEITLAYSSRVGVNFLALYNYLYQQLHLVEGYDRGLQEPIPEIINSTERGLIFRWDTIFTQQSYGIGFLNLNDNVSKDTITPFAGVQICREAYLYHLFSFTTIQADKQSKLHIIIIDRDAFLTCGDESTFNPFTGFLLPDIPPQPHQQLLAQPSLSPTATTLLFTLPEPSTSSLFIHELRSGQLIAQPLNQVWLDRGPHRIPLDISAWPAGLYVCTLRSEAELATVRLVKL